jgi:hypothetical protein
MNVIAAVLLIVALALLLFGEFSLAYTVLALAIVLITSLNYPDWRDRRACLRRIRARPTSELDVEYEKVGRRGGIDKDQVARLWNALAGFYGLPPSKVRANDRLDEELKGAVCHPNYDVFAGVRNQQRLVTAKAETIKDWAELIILVRDFEQERGALV